MKPFLFTFLFILCTLSTYAQSKIGIAILNPYNRLFTPKYYSDSQGNRQQPKTMTSISHDYFISHSGFFCKTEFRFEKKSNIPLRIRLGSLSYCNYLEQKPGYKYPEQ